MKFAPDPVLPIVSGDVLGMILPSLIVAGLFLIVVNLVRAVRSLPLTSARYVVTTFLVNLFVGTTTMMLLRQPRPTVVHFDEGAARAVARSAAEWAAEHGELPGEPGASYNSQSGDGHGVSCEVLLAGARPYAPEEGLREALGLGANTPMREQIVYARSEDGASATVTSLAPRGSRCERLDYIVRSEGGTHRVELAQIGH